MVTRAAAAAAEAKEVSRAATTAVEMTGDEVALAVVVPVAASVAAVAVLQEALEAAGVVQSYRDLGNSERHSLHRFLETL